MEGKSFTDGPTSALTSMQASELRTGDVYGESTQRIYQWIKESRKPPNLRLREHIPLETHFPDDPSKKLGEWVHIVVVTPESVCRCEYSNLSSQPYVTQF